MKKVLVTGAGGFIAHHLFTISSIRGCWVRGADLKYAGVSEGFASTGIGARR